MAPDRPIVVMVDDVQWSDGESLLALLPCVAGRRRNRVLFVLSVLPGDVRGAREYVRQLLDAADHTVELSTLGRDSVRLLLEETCGAPVHGAFVDVLRQRSGGNPLLVKALVDEVRYQALAPVEANCAAAAGLRPAGGPGSAWPSSCARSRTMSGASPTRWRCSAMPRTGSW